MNEANNTFEKSRTECLLVTKWFLAAAAGLMYHVSLLPGAGKRSV